MVDLIIDERFTHQSDEDAADIIDAMIFTGCLQGGQLERMQWYLDRWSNGLKAHRVIMENNE